jgi:hypothetical protein
VNHSHCKVHPDAKARLRMLDELCKQQDKMAGQGRSRHAESAPPGAGQRELTAEQTSSK